MKSILFVVLFLFVPKLCVSQISGNDKTIYLDSLWQETSQGNHKYYRIIKDYYSDKELYVINDYYKTGVLQMEGTSKTKDDKSKEGEFIFYYENGNKHFITYYKNGRPTGKQLSYYENGNLKEAGEYTENYDEAGKYYKLNQYWDENNKQLLIDGNGVYSYGNKIDYIETGIYKDGYRNGVFESKNLKENISFIEKYQNGKFISGTRTFADNTKSEYFEMETRPLPKKGMQDFYNFIGKHFKYTKESTKNNIQGKIIIKFVVDKNGEITEPTIIKGLGYGLDEEAMRVLLKYGNWIPGEQRGVKVRCSFSLPLAIQTGR